MDRKSIFRRASRHLWLAVTFELVAGLLISLGALWAFAGLSEEVFEGETARLDTTVLLWVNSAFPDWLGLPMRLITALGYPQVVVPLLLAAAYFFYHRGLKLHGILLLVSVSGAAILGATLKSFYERARPELFESGYAASFYSFPSGHAVTAASFYGLLTLLISRRLGGPVRWTVAASGVALVLLIGFSRIYFGVHYPSDVVAGFLAAALWVGAVISALVLWRSLEASRSKG